MIGNDLGLITVLIGLLFFGCAYAWLIAKLGQHKDGYTSLLVVAGVLVTLSGAAVVIGVPAVMVVLACFAASGTPMVIGDVVSYARQRAKDREELRRVVMGRAGDDKSESLAEPGRGNP